MKIILHIGQSKTGTTALQSVFSRNRDVLSEHKILYPDTFLKGKPLHALNHNPFANALGGYNFHPRLSADEYWEQFTQQFQSGNYETMLLSAESFFGGRPYLWECPAPDEYYAHHEQKLLKLKSYLDNCHVTVIAYLRLQNEWLESAIPQIIRYEGTMGQRIYKNDQQTLDMLSPRMDYNHMIGMWDKTLNPQEIKIKEYNRQKFSQQNVIIDFLEQIGVSDTRLETIHPSDNVHDSWSRDFIEVKKQLNLVKKSRIQEDTVIDIINRLNQNAPNKDKYRLEPDIHKAVLERFRESNHALSLQYNNGTTIFSEKVQKTPLSPLSDEQLSEAMRLFQQYSKSVKGRKLFAYNVLKRFLKKTSPYLYALCAQQWKKLKR